MKATVAILTILLAATVQLSAAPPKGMTAEQIQTLIKNAQKNGEAWAQDEKEDLSIEDALRYAQYDADSVEPLKQALPAVATLKSPANAYVMERLLRALANSDPAVIAQVMPTLRPIYSKLKNYRPLPPQMSDADAKRTFGNPTLPPNMPAPQRLKATEEIDKRRQAKLMAERPALKQNQAVGKLEATFMLVQVQMCDIQEDADLFKLGMSYLDQKNYSFTDAIRAFGNARGMSEERAKAIYTMAVQAGEPRRYERLPFTDYGDLFVNLSGASTFQNKEVQTGEALLSLAKKLSATAKQAEVNVPKREEIDAWQRAHPTPTPKPVKR